MRSWSFVDDVTLLCFSNGMISGRSFYAKYKNTENGGDVRNLLRIHGVEKSRQLALRAVKRRREKCVA